MESFVTEKFLPEVYLDFRYALQFFSCRLTTPEILHAVCHIYLANGTFMLRDDILRRWVTFFAFYARATDCTAHL